MIVTRFFISLFNSQHFWMLIHPSSGVCYLFLELFHGLYCSGIRIPHHPIQTTPKHQHASYQSNTTHEITQQISRKLLRMDVLTSETCWALNNAIKKANDIKLVYLYSTLNNVFKKLHLFWVNVEKYVIIGQAKDYRKTLHLQFTYCITNTTDSHSEYVTLITLPRQHWLRECASVLRL